MNKHLVTALAALAISAPLSAGEMAAIPFNELDTNKDDALSSNEVSALPGITAQWDSLDTDKDGQLNRGEYIGYRPAAPAAGEADK